MARRLIAGIAVALVMTWTIACSGKGGYPTEPTATPTAVPTAAASVPATAPNVSVDSFVGDWQADPVMDPAAIAEAEAAAARSCSQVEFKAVRDVDSKTAAVVFAATCARMRIHVVGVGNMVGDTLFWKARGEVKLPDAGRTCAATFVEGNKAQPAPEGRVKVTYNGTVCGAAVGGTALVRRR
jgi:hypothetical protein